MENRNQANLSYKNEQFVIWQDCNLNWNFNYKHLQGVSTQRKDLQTALNVIYESIEDVSKPHPKSKKKSPNIQKPVNLLDRLLQS